MLKRLYSSEGMSSNCVFAFNSIFNQWYLDIPLGAGTEQIFMRFGFLVYAIIVAELGTADFATHTICMSIITLSFLGCDGLSVAASALIGQNSSKL